MLDQDNDLTRLKGQSGTPKGQIVYVMGQVRDRHCRPIEGAVVEIWQASENGRYRHPRDRDNPAPLDPAFQYWGKNVTDKEGRYLFKTIKPGSYQAGRNWTRPPHIHFKVSHGDFRPFITQMYFAGDAHQQRDRDRHGKTGEDARVDAARTHGGLDPWQLQRRKSHPVHYRTRCKTA